MKYQAEFLGLTYMNQNDKNQMHKWRIKLGRYVFHFYTGLGLEGVVPKRDEVLYCLFTDAMYSQLDTVDFCLEMGYKHKEAKSILNKIKKNTDKLKKALGSQYDTICKEVLQNDTLG